MEVFLIKAAQLILSLSILVVLHELGHFIPAKLFKTRVEKFYLFFDVKFSLFKKKIGETVYGIGWLPLGGYVKIAGMVDESMDKEQLAQPEQPWEFRSKPAWQRLIIMIGGVTVNLLLGFFIYAMILFTWGQDQLKPESIKEGFAVSPTMRSYGFQDGDIVTAVDGETLESVADLSKYLLLRNVKNLTVKSQDGAVRTLSVPDSLGKMLFARGEMTPFSLKVAPIIDTVVAGMPAAKAGLQKGDKILSIGGEPIYYFSDVTPALTKAADDKPIAFAIERNGEAKTLYVSPNKEKKIGVNGVTPSSELSVTHKDYSLGEALTHGVAYGYGVLRDYVAQFKFIFTKKGASQVGGFGSIGNLFPSSWNWLAFWHITAFLSIALAFMNILPIPALDGGHVVFLLFEMATGRKPSEKVLEYAQMVGFVILISLLLYANGNDLYRAIFN